MFVKQRYVSAADGSASVSAEAELPAHQLTTQAADALVPMAQGPQAADEK